MRDAMSSPFWAEHMNDSIFIKDWSKWRQYNIMLEIKDDMFVSSLSLDYRY